MKPKYLLILTLVGLVAAGICYNSGAAEMAKKRISAADKAAIKEIFKKADPKTYRLEFDGGKDTMGTKKLTLASVRQMQQSGSGPEVGRVEFVARDSGVVYVWRVTTNRQVLIGQLGRERVARLDQIMAKYH